jgi:ectoine hydroxylase-related dioxygenase (phytanoyl-CoA dioxygenase family)
MPTTVPAPAQALNRLTPEQVRQYHAQGYLRGFRVFADDEVARLQAEYEELLKLLPPGTNVNFVNWWHKRNRFLYDLCTDPRLLDYVEDILGRNFFLWGSQFFVKEPGDETVVPWHQDAQYWPLAPQNAVTVFIAFTDCDPDNACMRVIPKTHRVGLLRHHTRDDGRSVLKQEIDEGEFDPADAVDLELKAGEISLHHDGIVHGSGANESDRRRVGFTMRFSSTDVKCDLSVWPTFQAFLARGVDEHRYNPAGVPPTTNDAPTGMRQ